MGSFPYSSLAPPTTDERAAVTDSISIATAGFKENFLRVVFLFNLDILIKNKFRLGLALTSKLPHPNKLLYLAFGFFTGSFRVLKDSSPRGTSPQFLPIPSLAKAQVRRPAMPIPPPISSVFSSKLAESFPRADSVRDKRLLT